MENSDQLKTLSIEGWQDGRVRFQTSSWVIRHYAEVSGWFRLCGHLHAGTSGGGVWDLIRTAQLVTSATQSLKSDDGDGVFRGNAIK